MLREGKESGMPRVFGLSVQVDGDAINQDWEYKRENSLEDPEAFSVHVSL